MAVVEMTVDLLTLLTCWPNTSRQAHALAYLRTRRARMARHALWFYELPRHTRWLLVGTDRVQSLLVFAVSTPAIDEKACQAWRKALIALNEAVSPPEGAVGVPNEGDEQRRDAVLACDENDAAPLGSTSTPATAPKRRSHESLKWEEPRGTGMGFAVAQLAEVVVGLDRAAPSLRSELRRRA